MTDPVGEMRPTTGHGAAIDGSPQPSTPAGVTAPDTIPDAGPPAGGHTADAPSAPADHGHEPEPPPSVRRVFEAKEPKREIERLLKLATQRGAFEVDDDDRCALGSLIAARDPDLLRCRRLIFEATVATDGRWAQAVGELVLPALPGDLIEHADVDGLLRSPRLEPARAAELLGEIADRLIVHTAAPSKGEDRRAQVRRRAAFNALMLVTVLLHRRSELDVDDIVATLSTRLGRPERGTRQGTIRQGVALEQLTDPRLTEERLRERLELARRWSDQLVDARARLRERDASDRALRAELHRREEELQAAQQRIVELEDEVSAKQEELHAAAARETGAEVAGRLDLLEVTGRVESFLSGRLEQHLVGAQQALDLDPPRAAIAAEKLELALDDVKERLEWLRSLA